MAWHRNRAAHERAARRLAFSFIVASLAATALGCDENAPPRLVSVRAEAAGENCPASGTRVDTGTDGNRDGTLSGPEIEETQFICEEGTLRVTTAEPPGDNCAAGGFKLEGGIDVSGDGTLDASEITTTSYVCNMGETLVEVSQEPFGETCVRGGLKIETGVDANADGVLDPDEVGAVDYQCQLYVVQASAGWAHTCWLLSDGRVRCAGYNWTGQLGRGDDVDSVVPVLVPDLAGVTQIAAGFDHTCALLEDQTVRCWGGNAHGQIGDGNAPERALTAAPPIAGLTGVTQIASSMSTVAEYSCALLAGGTVKCWGGGEHGRLGNGAEDDSPTPVEVTGVTNATQISLGAGHGCALLTTGEIRCWGLGVGGQLGNDAAESSSTPVAVSGVTSATQISAGGYFTCAAMKSGSVYCWGRDSDFELGDDDSLVTDTALADTPRQVDHGGASLMGVVQIEAGLHHACALTTDGQIRCWGRDADGQVGDGAADTTDQGTAHLVPKLADAVELDLGLYHTCVLTDDGRSICWGRNDFGQCGVGHDGEVHEPAFVSFGAGAVL